MAFAEAPSPPPPPPPPPTSPLQLNNDDFTIIVTLCSLLIVCACCWCYYEVERFFENQPQTQSLSSPPQHQQLPPVIINMQPESTVVVDAFNNKFNEVSWTDFKEYIRRFSVEDVVVSSSTCSICLEKFVDGDECMFRSTCLHIFHKACISNWLTGQRTCPLCRGDVPGNVRLLCSLDVPD